MANKLDPQRLARACGLASETAGIAIRSSLAPVAGAGSPVKPATYAGGTFQEDRRWWGEPLTETRVIVIDNTPSQANRLEAALDAHREPLGIPVFALDFSSIPSLPPHLPRILTSLMWPHRVGDAYLRDAMLNGVKIDKTEVGRALLDATAERPEALLKWFPQALLFGFWQSHLGKKRSQAKLARSWVSEIVGYDPATAGENTHVRGVKGDPLNLSVDEPASYDDDDLLAGWDIVAGSKSGKSKSKESLSEIGHGQVPFREGGTLAGVSFHHLEQTAAVSFAGLRRIQWPDPADAEVVRALLVSLGLFAHVAAFGTSFSLRSGCDLRPIESQWTWLDTQDEVIEAPSLSDARELFIACRSAVETRGLLADSGWNQPATQLTPNPALAGAIAKSWPVRD